MMCCCCCIGCVVLCICWLAAIVTLLFLILYLYGNKNQTIHKQTRLIITRCYSHMYTDTYECSMYVCLYKVEGSKGKENKQNVVVFFVVRAKPTLKTITTPMDDYTTASSKYRQFDWTFLFSTPNTPTKYRHFVHSLISFISCHLPHSTSFRILSQPFIYIFPLSLLK